MGKAVKSVKKLAKSTIGTTKDILHGDIGKAIQGGVPNSLAFLGLGAKKPKTPDAPGNDVMPLPDDELMRAAALRKAMRAAQGQGRTGTVLSANTGGGGLLG